jgi:subtilase family serine protease
MLLTSLLVVLALASIIVLVEGAHVKMESMQTRPHFNRLRRSPSNEPHELIFAVQQKNIDELEKIVLERSTPGSSKYLQWMSFDEVGEMISNQEALTSILDWLNAHNVRVTWKSQRGEYIKATAPLSMWENMLATEFYEWEDTHQSHKERPITHHRAEHYSLPDHLQKHVSAVFGTVQAPPIINSSHRTLNKNLFKSQLRVDVQSSSTVTVSYLNSYYRIATNIGSNLTACRFNVTSIINFEC